jgi:hypothetical protein
VTKHHRFLLRLHLNQIDTLDAGVTADTILVDALMDDAPKDEALPLLAFALQRLWRQYAASGALTRANYDKLGGLPGLIEDAAERALRGAVAPTGRKKAPAAFLRAW